MSGGKQYRVSLGDRILVDRIAAEPGTSVKIGRVLLFADGESTQVGTPAVDGLDVDARVIGHERGPRVESIRYKSKKRVRVHHGGRAHLTALEIIAVGGVQLEKKEEQEEEEKKPAGRSRGRAQATPRKKAAATRAEAEAEPAEAEESTPEPKAETPKRASRRGKKEESK